MTIDALRASEKQYQELVENANSIILRMDNHGEVTFFNEFAQGFFGYTPKEILGKSVVGTIVPAIESTGRDLALMVEDCVQNPERYSSTINENMRRDGERVWIAWTNMPIRYKNGQVVEMLCVGNDITERKRAEEKLRLSEGRLKRAEIAARLGYWEFILGSNKVVASEGARIIYGLEDREWSIPEIQEFPLPEYREMLDTALKNLVEKGEPYNVEHRVRRLTDGQIIDIHSIAEYSPEGRRVFGVVQDITERKQAEEALQQSERNYREIFNAVNDSIFIHDADTGAVLDVNDSMVHLFGFSREEALRLSLIRQVTAAPPTRQRRLSSGLERQWRKGPRFLNGTPERKTAGFSGRRSP